MPVGTPDTLKLVNTLSRKDIVFSIARLPGTNRAFLASSEFKVYETDLSQAKPQDKPLASHASYVTSVALAGKLLVSGAYDGRLIWWDVDQGSEVRSVEAHTKWIRHVAASPDGTVVASVADDMVCRLWDAASGKPVRELRGHEEKTPHHYPSMLYACTFSPDGRYLATGDKVGHVVVWETATGKQAAVLEAPVMYTWDPVQRRHSIGGIRSLAFSADGKLLAVGGMGKVGNIDHLEGKARVEVFEWEKGQRSHEFPGEKFNGLVEHLEFHPKGDWLLAAGGAGDGFLMFLDLATKKYLRQEKAAVHVHDFVFNDARDTLYAAGHQKIQVYEMKG
jgi:WD40 repeat protein